MAEARHLMTLGDMLPLTLVADLMGGLRQAMLRAGCTEPTIGSNLKVWAVLPEPGTRVEHHELTLRPSKVHRAMLEWSCSCGEAPAVSYDDVGVATFYATHHVPVGEAWSVVPDPVLWKRPDAVDV